MMAAKDPYMIIWEYSKGPRAWCQHGGDEDWTTIIKTATYESDHHKQIISISLSNRDHESDEGDFTVITAAHA